MLQCITGPVLAHVSKDGKHGLQLFCAQCVGVEGKQLVGILPILSLVEVVQHKDCKIGLGFCQVPLLQCVSDAWQRVPAGPTWSCGSRYKAIV